APPRRPPPLPRQPGALPPRAELLPLPRPGPRLRRLGARRPPALARAGGRGGAGGAAAVDVAVRADAGDATAAVRPDEPRRRSGEAGAPPPVAVGDEWREGTDRVSRPAPECVAQC